MLKLQPSDRPGWGTLLFVIVLGLLVIRVIDGLTPKPESARPAIKAEKVGEAYTKDDLPSNKRK